ncbi:MAG: hypothetical protein N2115_02450 [bacterium]|nr:hypothetical protein [bacterium]
METIEMRMRLWVFVLGILLCAGIGWIGVRISSDFSTGGALFFLFIVTFPFNWILWKIRKSWMLNRQELVLLYGMMVCASATVMGYANYLISYLGAPIYFADPQNRWAETIVPHLKAWFAPLDNEAIKLYFEGKPKGTPIPWDVWILPIISWLTFFLVFSFVMLCIMLMLRKQWEKRESLIYPLVRLPVEMMNCSLSSPVPPIFKNKLFWFGFTVVFILGSLNGLHYYFPMVPQSISVYKAPQIMLFRETIPLIFRISFIMIGFSYLINLNLSFSIWFLCLVFTMIQGVMNITGYSMTESMDVYSFVCGGPLFSHLQTGALIMLVILSLWRARHDLKRFFVSMVRNVESDFEDILSPRFVAWGFVIGFGFLVVWLRLAGLSFWAGILFLLTTFILFIGITRVVVEGGLAETKTPISSFTALISGFGSSAFDPSGLTVFGTSYTYAADTRSMFITSAAHTLKVYGIHFKKKSRIIIIGMLAAVISAFLAEVIFDIYTGYNHGKLNLVFVPDIQDSFNYISDHISNPKGPFVAGNWITLAGAGLMFTFTLMMQKFLWWPIHPLGLVVAAIWLTKQIWFSVFVAWLVKSLLLKYGGHKVYEKSIPLFLGFILGQFVAGGIWFFIGNITDENIIIFWL